MKWLYVLLILSGCSTPRKSFSGNNHLNIVEWMDVEDTDILEIRDNEHHTSCWIISEISYGKDKSISCVKDNGKE